MLYHIVSLMANMQGLCTMQEVQAFMNQAPHTNLASFRNLAPCRALPNLTSLISTQVEANNQLKAVTAEGANVLPARVIEDAFQNQYNKTLNYTDFKGAIQKLDKWYADRGIFGQVCFSTLPHLELFSISKRSVVFRSVISILEI